MSNKNILIFVILVALGVLAWMYRAELLKIDFDMNLGARTPEEQAWNTFQDYLEFAKNHDLPGIKNLSHQMSDACKDESRFHECLALMDSVYGLAKDLKKSDFVNVESDSKQIVMYTDGPDMVILYFTLDESGAPKVLAIRFCTDIPDATETCVQGNVSTTDTDKDGYWDKVEELFYK